MIAYQITVQIGEKDAAVTVGSWKEVAEALERATSFLPLGEAFAVLDKIAVGPDGADGIALGGEGWRIVAQRLPDAETWSPGDPLQVKDPTVDA